MDLPNDLRLALVSELASLPQKNVADAAGKLSQRYRREQLPKNGSFLHSPGDVLAYAAYRLPATFAAIYAALNAVQQRRPDWQPRTLLDAGTGPGSALWAANEIWPELEQVTLLERDAHMIAFGKQLTTHSRSAAVNQASWQKVDLLGTWQAEPKDLVTTTYVLGELPAIQREGLIAKLWTITLNTLVIIEPGTPAGFARIRQARQQLIDAGAHIIAPCPHALPCPMGDNNWCHFAQRITRSNAAIRGRKIFLCRGIQNKGVANRRTRH
jgi:ribosomal protein RSM22 (predicted rRNA methylase)